ncbi:unnamed protein product [Gordionus sp. m RMFG-2023]|uniref:charged multivesicular body protein 6-A-like n=1 Tax=Gordionus sp. m RMFG-2023 TaxID=3053472 RepID=UPI0030DF2C20
MGDLFSKLSGKRRTKITEHDIIVLQMKRQRDNLHQYRMRLENNMEKERRMAKKLLSEGRREKAKLLLKKKRFQENLLEKNENILDQVETMIYNIEFSNIQTEVVHNLKLGNDCLKQLNQLFSIDDIEKIMEETREGAEYQKQIEGIISLNFTQEDENDVLKELNEILDQTNLVLPDVPKEPLIKDKIPIKSPFKQKIPLQA